MAIPLGTGDVISISVFNEPELALREKIGQSGTVSMPLIGAVSVVGKLPQTLAEELSAAYEDGYLVNADVSVKVESYRAFFVGGAVFRPGAYEYVIDLTVEQAIAIAGGLRERASRKNWLILRGSDKQKIKAQAHTPLMPGDILTIEESLF
ncbi:polysaccharide biosynthesis/export family protein [Alteromonas oceanisediminis]|uniref:polysaccharide biosynthesis/export family protein n=1 Tax=Alteromonas oceanisediminis TaxID=2836180 RepID=UPI0028F4356B|nr:polysaccharide biosynthesis/export family protein [Alteromonas oceanisediminis]